MAKEKTDIEVPAETAGGVKGGVRPPEPSGPSRGVSGSKKHTKHVKKVAGPSGGMPHQ
jgi:hypothetical protein